MQNVEKTLPFCNFNVRFAIFSYITASLQCSSTEFEKNLKTSARGFYTAECSKVTNAFLPKLSDRRHCFLILVHSSLSSYSSFSFSSHYSSINLFLLQLLLLFIFCTSYRFLMSPRLTKIGIVQDPSLSD